MTQTISSRCITASVAKSDRNPRGAERAALAGAAPLEIEVAAQFRHMPLGSHVVEGVLDSAVG